MMQQWHEWSEKFDALSARERGLVAMSVTAFLFVLAYLIFEPYWLERGKLDKGIAAMTQDNKKLQTQIKLFETRLSVDPNQDYRQRLVSLKSQLGDLDGQFATHNVVPANYMPTLLNAVLEKARNIKVLSFKSLPPESLLQGKGDKENINLYSHGVRLVIQGDYFSVLKFMKAVEEMPDKLYWKSMDYRVKDYPDADVVLEFYTLSINKDFISVAN